MADQNNKLGAQVPDAIIEAIRIYGDERADGKATCSMRMADVILALRRHYRAAPAVPAVDALTELGLLDEIECDLPYLFGRAALEGHDVSQKLASEVRAKMKRARKVLATPSTAPDEQKQVEIDTPEFREALSVYAQNHGGTGENAARFEVIETVIELLAATGRKVSSDLAHPADAGAVAVEQAKLAEFIEQYEWRTDEFCHAPTATERGMLHDFAVMLHDEFASQPQATPLEATSERKPLTVPEIRVINTNVIGRYPTLAKASDEAIKELVREVEQHHDIGSAK